MPALDRRARVLAEQALHVGHRQPVARDLVRRSRGTAAAASRRRPAAPAPCCCRSSRSSGRAPRCSSSPVSAQMSAMSCVPVAQCAVTTFSSAAKPRRTWNGSHGLFSSHSPKQSDTRPGLAEDRLAHRAGNRAADVAHHQAQGAADGGVGAAVVAEAAVAALDAERGARRAVDHQRRRGATGRGVERVEIEARRADGAHRRHHGRKARRRAAGHHRVDGDLLGRRLAAPRLDDADHRLRRFLDGLEHRLHALRASAGSAAGRRPSPRASAKAKNASASAGTACVSDVSVPRMDRRQSSDVDSGLIEQDRAAQRGQPSRKRSSLNVRPSSTSVVSEQRHRLIEPLLGDAVDLVRGARLHRVRQHEHGDRDRRRGRAAAVRARLANTSVTTTAAGLPARSTSIVSWTLHDVHDPQVPRPTIAASMSRTKPGHLAALLLGGADADVGIEDHDVAHVPGARAPARRSGWRSAVNDCQVSSMRSPSTRRRDRSSSAAAGRVDALGRPEHAWGRAR